MVRAAAAFVNRKSGFYPVSMHRNETVRDPIQVWLPKIKKPDSDKYRIWLRRRVMKIVSSLPSDFFTYSLFIRFWAAFVHLPRRSTAYPIPIDDQTGKSFQQFADFTKVYAQTGRNKA